MQIKGKSGLSSLLTFYNITFFDFAHAETEIGPKLYEQLICSKWVNFMSLAKTECCVQMECVFFCFLFF